MKSFKNVLAALAFVFAFGAAFTLDANNSVASQAFGQFTPNSCSLANLIEDNCSTIVTGTRCNVQGVVPTPAFQATDGLGKCIQPLYRQQ